MTSGQVEDLTALTPVTGRPASTAPHRPQRLPVLPALVRTVGQQRTAARARLDAALPAAPGQVVEVHGEKLRRNAVAGRIYVTDLAAGRRRDLTF